MNAGGAARRDQSWWFSHGRSVSIDPSRVNLRSGPIHRADVERYKADPSSRATGGDPVCVVRLRDGSLFAREGAHRITAAQEAGRPIDVRWVHEHEEQGERAEAER